RILDAKVQAVSLEFARRGEDDLRLFKELDVPVALGFGVGDVKTDDIAPACAGRAVKTREGAPPGSVAARIRRALAVIPAERLIINPDCGCVRLPRDVAFRKLQAMSERTQLVREDLPR